MMKGKQATIWKMHQSDMHCPLCVFLQCPALYFGYILWNKISFYVLFVQCLAYSCVSWYVIIGKVAECALPP